MTDLNQLKAMTRSAQLVTTMAGTEPAHVRVLASTMDALIARIEHLEAENARLKTGLNATCEVVSHHCKSLTEATHSQDLLFDDEGDGDFEAMWDRARENYEAAQKVPALEAALQRVRDVLDDQRGEFKQRGMTVILKDLHETINTLGDQS